MDIEDFTYEHQIINQAKYLIDAESEGKINDTQLNPKNILSMKIFGSLINSNRFFNSDVRFAELNQIIDDYLRSSNTPKSLTKFTGRLKENLSIVKYDDANLKDILDQMEFLILLSFMNNQSNYKFIDPLLLEDLITKLQELNIHNDYLFLFKTYNDKYDKDTFSQTPEKNIMVEALLQLKLNELINSDNITRDFYRKIKTRRLLFIKEVHDKLDLFKNQSIFKPSNQLIYEVVMASSVLILLSYNKIISLNKQESQIYLDKEIDSEMIELEVSKRVEEARKRIITFSLPLATILGEKFKVPMFYVISVYISIWVIFSILLYCHYFFYNDVFIGAILVFTIYLLYESYVKSFRKIN